MVIRRSELKRIYIMDIEVIRLVLADKKNITREVAKELGEVWPLMRHWEKRVKRRFKVKNIKPPKKKKTVTKKKKLSSLSIFYKSYEWSKIRYEVLKLNNGCCELCGRSKKDGVILNVDHIKSARRYPKLRLVMSNLQVLCGMCNKGKSNWDDTDWREPSLKALMGEEMP